MIDGDSVGPAAQGRDSTDAGTAQAPVTKDQRLGAGIEGGRPSYKTEIQEAGRSLLKRKKIDPDHPLKMTAHTVREHLLDRFGTDDAKGLDDRTISRHLKSILEAQGKTRG